MYKEAPGFRPPHHGGDAAACIWRNQALALPPNSSLSLCSCMQCAHTRRASLRTPPPSAGEVDGLRRRPLQLGAGGAPQPPRRGRGGGARHITAMSLPHATSSTTRPPPHPPYATSSTMCCHHCHVTATSLPHHCHHCSSVLAAHLSHHAGAAAVGHACRPIRVYRAFLVEPPRAQVRHSIWPFRQR